MGAPGPKLTKDSAHLGTFKDYKVYGKLVDRMGSRVFLLQDGGVASLPSDRRKQAWLVVFSGYLSREEREAGKTFSADKHDVGPALINKREARKLIKILQGFIDWSEEQEKEQADRAHPCRTREVTT